MSSSGLGASSIVATGVNPPSYLRKRQLNPIGGDHVSIENLEAFLMQNGLPETIEMLHATAPRSFGMNETEALDKLKLILRILDMPADTAGTLVGLIEELAPEGKSRSR